MYNRNAISYEKKSFSFSLEYDLIGDLGKTIKTLAQVLCWIGIIASVIAGIVLLNDEDTIVFGVLIILIGPLLSWANNIALYGIGELIDKASEVLQNTRKIKSEIVKDSTEEEE